MGASCGCVAQNGEGEEVLTGRPDSKDKKQDTITIPNGASSTGVVTKKKITVQGGEEYEEDDNQEIQQNDIKKRDGKKKQAKINAVQDVQEILENITMTDKKKSPFDFQLILNAFNEHFIFKSIPPTDIEFLIEKMFYCTVPDGQFVFKQGDKGSTYFLIERGSCQIIINGECKKTLKNGNAFGELALLYNAPRSASVKAQGDCAFWAIDRNTFRRVVEQQNLKDYSENKQFIRNVKFFDFLTDEQRDAISSVLITMVFKKGELIVNQGDMANSFYVIKQGKVAIVKDEKEIRQMAMGESFGEQALFQNSQRAASVKAVDEEVRCLALAREDLSRILGQKIQVIMYINMQRWAFERSTVFNKLTSIQIEKILQNTRQVHYEDKEIVLKEGTQLTKLYIVLEGELLTITGRSVTEKGKIFGEAYAQQGAKKDIPENILMKGNGVLAEIDFKIFFELIGGSLEQALQKNNNNHEQKYLNRPSVMSKSDYTHLKLDSLISIKKLGQGQFGNVYLVKSKDDNDSKIYALKCISKAQIVEQHLERHLAQEKQVLSMVQFPFLMKFYRSFKDQNFIYFLVEYIKGMELFDVIREIGLLSSYDSTFYIGSLLLCVEYLHKNQMIYRDIKPENIMVDEKVFINYMQGYLRMIDMGTAKILNQKGARTYTIIGTPHYMAPEIIQGKGYTFSVDLWSIGVCLYEFMCGGVPYAEDADDPYEIYEEINKKSLTYPSFFKDRKARRLIEQLLSKTPELRLGGSYAALKANPWFDQFDWDKLMDRELKVPFAPKKTKLVSDKDIAAAMSAGKPASKEVQGAAYKKEKAKDPNWDKDY